MLRRTHTAALWQTEITARLRAALRGRSRTGSCWEGGRSGAKAESRNCVHARLPNCLRRPWGSPPRSTSHAEHLGYPTRAKLRQKCSDERTQQLYGRPKSLCPPCGSEGGSNPARRCNPLRAAAPSSQLHFSSYTSLANTFRQLGPPSWVPHAAIFRALRSRSNREARAPLQGIMVSMR